MESYISSVSPASISILRHPPPSLSEKHAALLLRRRPLLERLQVSRRGGGHQETFPPTDKMVPDGGPPHVDMDVGIAPLGGHEDVELHF